jgi:hypothetical protein
MAARFPAPLSVPLMVPFDWVGLEPGSMTGTPGRQPLNVESPARMNTVAKAQKTDTRRRDVSAGCNTMSDALAYGRGVAEDDSASGSYRDDRQLATPHPDADSRSDGAEKHQKGPACHHNSLWSALNATSVPEDCDTVEVVAADRLII